MINYLIESMKRLNYVANQGSRQKVVVQRGGVRFHLGSTQMVYYVYLIVAKVKNRTISYVGYTNNLNKRIKLHNANKGAKFTKGKKWKLVYYEEYDSKYEAMKNEYSLKKNYTLRNKLKIGKKN